MKVTRIIVKGLKFVLLFTLVMVLTMGIRLLGNDKNDNKLSALKFISHVNVAEADVFTLECDCGCGCGCH
jgi:hypothetical protein